MQRIEKMKLFVGKNQKHEAALRVAVGLTGLIGGAVLSAVSAAFLERQTGYRFGYDAGFDAGMEQEYNVIKEGLKSELGSKENAEHMLDEAFLRFAENNS